MGLKNVMYTCKFLSKVDCTSANPLNRKRKFIYLDRNIERQNVWFLRENMKMNKRILLRSPLSHVGTTLSGLSGG